MASFATQCMGCIQKCTLALSASRSVEGGAPLPSPKPEKNIVCRSSEQPPSGGGPGRLLFAPVRTRPMKSQSYGVVVMTAAVRCRWGGGGGSLKTLLYRRTIAQEGARRKDGEI